MLLHLSVAPYTKIEESFTIQATHDIWTFGVPFWNTTQYLAARYDHLQYPEFHPVPRTFVAPLALAGASWPFAWLVEGVDRQILGESVDTQCERTSLTAVIVRAVLGIFNAFSMLAYRNAVAGAFGRTTANWYLLFQASQFHIIFYASRTLPNFVPFGLSAFAVPLLG